MPAIPPPAAGPAACTIIARNYLSYAAILAESYLAHAPGARFYLLVVDGLPAEAAALPEGVQIVSADELEHAAYFEMCFKYDVTELCTAVKPALLRCLLERYGEREVAYFDPDILVLRPLDELRSALATADVVLNPHLSAPIPRDGLKPSEEDILIAGAYNLGFIALRASETADRLLAWWSDRLEDGCRVDPARGLFVDQRWVDLVPGLFPSTCMLRDEGYNVAYWNLHSRTVRREGEAYFVGDRPLAFFHFSGFDPERPQLLSRHQTRTRVQKGSPLADLLHHYAGLHARHGHAQCSRWTYGFSRFGNGTPIGHPFRRLYLGLESHRRLAFGDPFRAGPGSFYEWATRFPPDARGLSPFAQTVYDLRPDIRAAFPDVKGRDRAAFLNWARTSGARDFGYPSSLLEADPLGVAPAVAGVNVIGYLRNETGLGAASRGYVSALKSLRVPVALLDVSDLSPSRSEDLSITEFDDLHPHPVNLVCVNADQHFVLASHLGQAVFEGRYSVALWFWELPDFPEAWRDRFACYDEVWAPSNFIANALAPVSPRPVVRVPVVLGDAAGDREDGRARLGAAPGEFVWLFVFDYRSYAERKNPLGLIAAFRRAFTPSDPVRLMIKTVNAATDPEARRAVHAAAEGHRISVVDGYWDAGEMRDLLSACDGYASLHRSEGLGLPLANAMGLGKPVVATGWSGNMDFMDATNSFPVPYDLVRLARDVGPYRAGSTWAEPSIEAAAEQLRTVSAGGPDVDARTEAGRRTIATQYSVEAVARVVETRLATIGAEVLGTAPRRSREANAMATSASARGWTPVLPPLDLQTSQYGWLGRLGKRMAALMVRYHSFHQQQVNAILASSIGELNARVERLSQAAGGDGARAGAEARAQGSAVKLQRP